MKNRTELAIENIRRYIADTGITQRALAKSADLSPVNLNQIIKKKKGLGDVVAERLAKAMGISISDLYRDESANLAPAIQRAPTRPESIGRILAALESMSDQEVSGLMKTLEAGAGPRKKSKLKV